MINAPIYAMPQAAAPMHTVTPEKQFNAVSIKIDKPTVEAGSQTESPYNYPQASVYAYPQANVYPPAAPVSEVPAQEIKQPEQYQVPEPVITEAQPQEATAV